MELGLSIAAKSSGQRYSASAAERLAARELRFASIFAERQAAYELRRAQVFAQPASAPHSYPKPGGSLRCLDRRSVQPCEGRDLPRAAKSSGPPSLLPLPPSSGYRALLWRMPAPHQSQC